MPHIAIMWKICYTAQRELHSPVIDPPVSAVIPRLLTHKGVGMEEGGKGGEGEGGGIHKGAEMLKIKLKKGWGEGWRRRVNLWRVWKQTEKRE